MLCSFLDSCPCQIQHVKFENNVDPADFASSPQADGFQSDTACSGDEMIETASTTTSGLKPSEGITGKGSAIKAKADQNSPLTSTSTVVHERYIDCGKMLCYIMSAADVSFL